MFGIIIGIITYLSTLLLFNNITVAIVISISLSSLIYYLMGYFDGEESTYQRKQEDGIYECVKCEKKNTSFTKRPRLNGTTEIYISCNNCIRGWKIIEKF